MTMVKLEVNGLRASLDNGLIKIYLNERGSVDSILKEGSELLVGLEGAPNDINKKRSFYLDYHANGKFRDFNPESLKIIKQEKQLVHLAYVDTTSLLYAEYHYIMEAGISGVYSYVIVKHHHQEPLKVGELRTVYRMGIENFNSSYNAERVSQQPTHLELQKQIIIQDETFKDENGAVYTKYDDAGYFKENPVWGQYGDRFGAWFIPVSTEYYSGGPLKQELLVHYDGIILNYMTGAHFGSGVFEVPQGWEKLYGPWLMYFNSGEPEAIIKDAKEKAVEEQKKWPYQWVQEDLYPLKRATVKGKIIIKDGRSSAGAMVILAKPGGEVLRQKADYIFYETCDEDGAFELHQVRPGDYTLYAYATGGTVTGQLIKENIVIEAGEVDLGSILWEAPNHSQLLWQLGQANRETTGFKYSDQLRGYKWMTQLPQQLDFEIGKSCETTDWYYAQPRDATWNIHFQLDQPYNQPIYLTLALAGATSYKMGTEHQSTLTLFVNNQPIKELSYDNDATVYRSGLRSGRYHLEELTFNGSLLQQGKNTITLKSSNGSFMYDTILLETEESGTLLTHSQLIDHYCCSRYIDAHTAKQLKSFLATKRFPDLLEYLNGINLDSRIREVIQRNIGGI